MEIYITSASTHLVELNSNHMDRLRNLSAACDIPDAVQKFIDQSFEVMVSSHVEVVRHNFRTAFNLLRAEDSKGDCNFTELQKQRLEVLAYLANFLLDLEAAINERGLTDDATLFFIPSRILRHLSRDMH